MGNIEQISSFVVKFQKFDFLKVSYYICQIDSGLIFSFFLATIF